MPELLADATVRLGTQGQIILPFLLSLWMAGGDVRTRRIPNYLTLGTALAGLAFQTGSHGLAGLGDGFLGMVLGFCLLLLPYILGGMGAGDLKALAALGAWLGPWSTLVLFCYMGVAGGVLALGVLAWRGLLWVRLRQGLVLGWNRVLCRSYGLAPAPAITVETKGIPYGVAIFLGMGVLLWRGG